MLKIAEQVIEELYYNCIETGEDISDEGEDDTWLLFYKKGFTDAFKIIFGILGKSSKEGHN